MSIRTREDGEHGAPSRPVRIANCSGFFGDRMSALEEMVTGGPIDVVTGDYLAEVTMLVIARSRLRNPDAGYASSFLRQLKPVAGEDRYAAHQSRRQRGRPEPRRPGGGDERDAERARRGPRRRVRRGRRPRRPHPRAMARRNSSRESRYRGLVLRLGTRPTHRKCVPGWLRDQGRSL